MQGSCPWRLITGVKQPARETEELPPPAAAIVLWRVSVEAFIATAPRRRSETFLRLMAEMLASEENLSAVFHIRPTSERAAVAKARREAAAMFEKLLPLFLARLPRD